VVNKQCDLEDRSYFLYSSLYNKQAMLMQQTLSSHLFTECNRHTGKNCCMHRLLAQGYVTSKDSPEKCYIPKAMKQQKKWKHLKLEVGNWLLLPQRLAFGKQLDVCQYISADIQLLIFHGMIHLFRIKDGWWPDTFWCCTIVDFVSCVHHVFLRGQGCFLEAFKSLTEQTLLGGHFHIGLELDEV